MLPLPRSECLQDGTHLCRCLGLRTLWCSIKPRHKISGHRAVLPLLGKQIRNDRSDNGRTQIGPLFGSGIEFLESAPFGEFICIAYRL